MITCTVDLGTTLRRLAKVPRDAARIIETAIDTDAKGFVRDIVGITPPSMGKANVAAKQRGATAINRDVRRVYGTMGALYERIRARSKGAAAAFWKAANLKQWQECDRICRSVGEPLLTDFISEDGTEHQRRRNRRDGRVTGKQPSVFVRETRSLRAYIKSTQSRVGLLAAGFKPAASHLRVSLPAWVQRHALQPGTIRLHRAPGQYSITISNTARHGRGTDLSRRMRYVLQSDKRKKRLIHRINAEIRVALRHNHLTTR